MLPPKRGFLFGSFFLDMHCEKNEGGTRNLILKGNELFETIGQRVNDGDLLRITLYLRDNPDIVSLELPYNEITSCGMRTLTNCLTRSRSIKHLNLIGNDINSSGIRHLVDVAERLNLFSLRLSGNKFGDKGGTSLSELLYENTPLKILDMSDTHQTMSGLAHLLTALMPSRGGTETLEYIDLGRPLPQAFHELNHGHIAEFICQVFSDNKSLKEIHLQQYGFDFRDAELMLKGLLANNTLICLDLNNNNIGDDGVKYLCKYLETGPSLECLMIGANGFGDHGACSLSRSLPFSNIKLLDVTNNHIRDEGIINLLYTINKPQKMRGLFLWGNTMTHESLVVLQRLFKTKLLDPEHTDVSIYVSDDKLHASWNYEANRYTQRFYCVSTFSHSPKRKLVLNPLPPEQKPEVYYKHHVDNAVIGFPMCEWLEN